MDEGEVGVRSMEELRGRRDPGEATAEWIPPATAAVDRRKGDLGNLTGIRFGRGE